MEFYEPEDLELVLRRRSAQILEVDLRPDGAAEIACRSRGTPRIANRLLRRVRDFAEVRADGAVTREVARAALAVYDVDELGLDRLDRAVLSALVRVFGGGPVGVSTLAVAVGEEPGTVEEVCEPYLVRAGMLARTPRGRVATRGGMGAPRGAGTAADVLAATPACTVLTGRAGRLAGHRHAEDDGDHGITRRPAVPPAHPRCCSSRSSCRGASSAGRCRSSRSLQSALQVGDVVMTTSGLRGTVVDVSDEDTIDLEIAPAWSPPGCAPRCASGCSTRSAADAPTSEIPASDDTVSDTTAAGTPVVAADQPRPGRSGRHRSAAWTPSRRRRPTPRATPTAPPARSTARP